MTNPNTLPQTGEAAPTLHKDASATVIHFANQSMEAETAQYPPIDKEFAQHPTSWRAMSGSHPTWLGFDSNGTPK